MEEETAQHMGQLMEELRDSNDEIARQIKKMRTANIYEPGPLTPVCKIKENIAIWTTGKWSGYHVEFIEPMPRSSQSTVEMITAAGGTTLAANGTIQKQIVQLLLLTDNEFSQFRFEPIDDIECVLWEQASIGRFATRGMQGRITQWTNIRDPYLMSSTFWIIGKDRDPHIEVVNPQPVAIPSARVAFWGYRYFLSPLETIPEGSVFVLAEGR